MALINVEGSLPSPMWAVVRFLSFMKKPVPVDQCRALLSPSSLSSDDGATDRTFDLAVSTLRGLGLVSVEEGNGDLRLADVLRDLGQEDLDAYTRLLRDAVLAPDRNTGLADSGDQSGPRDLTRALAWFLSLDPMDPPVNWESAQLQQQDALKPEVGSPFSNDIRWQRFGYWAPALGLAARPLIPSGGSSPLTPDCTLAVRQAMFERWQPGMHINAVETLRALRGALPVLPGGGYSQALGITSPGETAAGTALSFALLRGEDEGWIRFESNADARRVLSLHDPERPLSPRYVSDITILEDHRG
ncbi:protein DpdG [Kitasatospora aureofaciens]|uniref:protein DpdG n=1 Tax=Kitasatospora aureofaciens TaxID=1894 RepID=UPI0036F474DE